MLQREQMFIYVSSEVEARGADFCGLVAHELGHYFLDATKPATTVAHLETLLGSAGSPAVLKVEAYGARGAAGATGKCVRPRALVAASRCSSTCIGRKWACGDRSRTGHPVGVRSTADA